MTTDEDYCDDCGRLLCTCRGTDIIEQTYPRCAWDSQEEPDEQPFYVRMPRAKGFV